MGTKIALTRLPDARFWRGSRVLVTGHTGFKGSWLCLWLIGLGAELHGISLEPDSEPSLFVATGLQDKMESHICDIRDTAELAAKVSEIDPEFVLHLAAQSIVRTSYADPIRTFATNVMGTANLLDALRSAPSVRTIVCVTTDKVYKNLEHHRPYIESDELGGYDPYSASKAAAEITAHSFRQSFLDLQNIGLSTARAGNVIGGGDWAKDRLLPDAVRAWGAGETLPVRRPEAVRPWQHVLEPVCGYLVLAEQLQETPNIAGAYNIGPAPNTDATVRHVIERAFRVWAARHPPTSTQDMIEWEARMEGPHETHHLSLDPAKAAAALGLYPVWNVETAIARTIDWYCSFANGEDAAELCAADIALFMKTAADSIPAVGPAGQ